MPHTARRAWPFHPMFTRHGLLNARWGSAARTAAGGAGTSGAAPAGSAARLRRCAPLTLSAVHTAQDRHASAKILANMTPRWSSSLVGGRCVLQVPASSLVGGVRFASSSSSKQSPLNKIRSAFTKVGDGIYHDFLLPAWSRLAAIGDADVLTTLAAKANEHLKRALTEVHLSQRRVFMLGHTRSPTKPLPGEADESLDRLVEVKGAVTLGDAVEKTGDLGDTRWRQVKLPPTAAPPLPCSSTELLRTCLRHATLHKIHDQPDGGCTVLVLRNEAGEPVHWPGLSSPTLLVRPMYREFYEREDLLNEFSDWGPSRQDRILVRGIPGTGTSAFALYCLWRLVTDKRHTVVYRNSSHMAADLVFEGRRSGEGVSIGDGVAPHPDVPAQLMVASTDEASVNRYANGAVCLYMPEPTELEMRLMRDLCFPEAPISDALLEERISRWGRVPRAVFALGHHETDAWDRVVHGFSVKDACQFAKQPVHSAFAPERTTLVQQVIHYGFTFDTAAAHTWGHPTVSPFRNYMQVSRRWASPRVQELVWDRLLEAWDRLDRLREIFCDPAFLKSSGTLWAKWCHEAFSKGSENVDNKGFRIRRLTHFPSECGGTGVPADSGVSEAGSGGNPVAAALGQRADQLLAIIKPAEGGPWRMRVSPATSYTFTSLSDLAGQAGGLQSGQGKRRYVSPLGVTGIDAWEAHLPYPCGSNASVSLTNKLLLQGATTESGWRAVAEALMPDRAPGDPLIHLWLVPTNVFDCRVAAETVCLGADEATQVLAPLIVQYAVCVPYPDSHDVHEDDGDWQRSWEADYDEDSCGKGGSFGSCIKPETTEENRNAADDCGDNYGEGGGDDADVENDEGAADEAAKQHCSDAEHGDRSEEAQDDEQGEGEAVADVDGEASADGEGEAAAHDDSTGSACGDVDTDGSDVEAGEASSVYNCEDSDSSYFDDSGSNDYDCYYS